MIRIIVNLLFGLIGVWMAHTFYQSPRKREETVFTVKAGLKMQISSKR